MILRTLAIAVTQRTLAEFFLFIPAIPQHFYSWNADDLRTYRALSQPLTFENRDELLFFWLWLVALHHESIKPHAVQWSEPRLVRRLLTLKLPSPA